VTKTRSCPSGHAWGRVVPDGVLKIHGTTRERFRCEQPDGSFHRFTDTPDVTAGPSRPEPATEQMMRVPAAPRVPRQRTMHTGSQWHLPAPPAPAVPVMPVHPTALARTGESAAVGHTAVIDHGVATDTDVIPAGLARQVEEAFEETAAVAPAPGMPGAPSDEEKYSYFGSRKRWPFVWLFISQLLLVYSFVMVMKRNPDAALGLILLTFMVPPIFVNFWLRIRPHRTVLSEHVDKVDAWQAGRRDFPSVDVMLPSCGEPLDVLANTFEHVGRLEWQGRLNVYVLDDAAVPEVRELAEQYGFRYLVRPNRGEWKKAGNLIYGFEQSDGDFLVVFDADFAPRRDFLAEVVPYMDDERVGIVQTAQYFDTEGVNYFARFAGTLQELFFRWIQPARDTYEAAICAGTNVLYRRAAVVAAGGFAKVPLGEDVHSGVKVWVANYRTRYIPLVLAKGLAPDSWAALTNQQYRWCRSSMLLMNSTFFKDAPFSFAQRVCYWAAFLYYMASAAMVLTSTLPTLVMLWFYPTQIHWWNYLPMLPGILGTLFIFPKLARGWSLKIYRVTTINSFCHLLAVTDAMRQKVAAWVPTGAVTKEKKKGASTPAKVAVLLRTWTVVVQVLLWAGIVHAFLTAPVSIAGYVPAAFLALLQLYMLAPFLRRLDPRGMVETARPTRAARQATRDLDADLPVTRSAVAPVIAPRSAL